MRLCILVTIAACAWASDPDPVELARRSMQAVEANRPKARQYAYRQYHVNRELDAKGKETDRETKTWDVIGLEGSTYQKLVMLNDRPLSGKQEKEEEKRLTAEAERRRKETPEERKKRLFSVTYSFHLPYDRLVDICDLRYVGEKEIDGRWAYGIAAVPKADFHPVTEDEKESLNYKFVLWLDREDAFPGHVDAEIIGTHSRLEKGTTIRADDERLPDGVWMPKMSTVRYTVKFLKVHTVRGEAVTSYTDFHKFQTDSTLQFAEKEK